MRGQMELSNTNLQIIDLNPSSSKQAHSNTLGVGHAYKSTEPGCILTVLRVPSVIRPLSDIKLAHSIQLSSRPEKGQSYGSCSQYFGPVSHLRKSPHQCDAKKHNGTKW